MKKRPSRLSEERVGQICGQAKKRGFAIARAFMRAIERELSGSETMRDSTEARLAATNDRFAGELRRWMRLPRPFSLPYQTARVQSCADTCGNRNAVFMIDDRPRRNVHDNGADVR